MSLLDCLCCPKHKFRTAAISDDLNTSSTETYWNILARACRLACYLRHTLAHLSGQGSSNVIIALWTESCPEAVSGMLGILSTPATYLPVSTAQAPPPASPLEGVEGRLRRMEVGVVLVHHACVQHFTSEDWSNAHVAMDTSLLELGFICATITWHHTIPSPSPHTPHPSPLTSSSQHCTPTKICADCHTISNSHLSPSTTRLKLPEDTLTTYQQDTPTPCLVCALHTHSTHDSNLATNSWDLPPLPPSSLAYVLHTSGTTGHPKLVWVPHCCIVPNIVDLRKRFHMHPDDCVFNAAPLTFDPSVVEIFLALSSGAAVLLVSDSVRRSPSDLAEVLFQREPVTVLQTTPTLFHRFQEREISTRVLGERSHVRVLAFGGERCPSLTELAKYKSKMNSTHIFNLYGTTEVSCWGSCHRVSQEEIESACDREDVHSFSQEEEEEEGEEGGMGEGEAVMVERERVPLGEALLGTQLEVRAAPSCLPVHYGSGELWLGGGYRVCLLGNETGPTPSCMRRTGDRGWVSRDGSVYFAGRLDRQIKRQGHRLRLDFIEEHIQSLEAVSACAVIEIPPSAQTRLFPLAGLHRTRTDDSSPADSLLVAFAVPRHWPAQATGIFGSEWSEQLLSLLVRSLPGYCVPDMVVPVRFIPVNQHGKADLTSLKYFDNPSLPLPSADPPLPSTEPLTASSVETHLQSLVSRLTTLPGWPAALTLLELGATSFEVVRIAIAMEMGFSGRGQLSGLTELLLSRSLREVVDYVIGRLREGRSEGAGPRKRKQEECLPPPPRKRGQTSPPVAALAWRRGQLFRDGELSPTPIPTAPRDRADLASCSLAIRWTFDTGRCVDASPLVVKQESAPLAVYVGSHSGLFVCLGVESGLPLWQAQLSDRVESSACLSRCGGHVIVGCYDGNVYTLGAGTGHVYWRVQPSSEPIKSSPCVDPSNGIVWVGSHDHCLYGIDIVGKSIVHRVHLGGGACFSSPCADVHRGLVYAATLQGRVVGVCQANGTILWTFPCPKPVFSSPSLLPSGEVVVGCVDGHVYVINHEGWEVDRLYTEQPIFSSCSVATSEVVDVSGGKSRTDVSGRAVSVSERRGKEEVGEGVGEGGGEEREEEGVGMMEIVKGERVGGGGEEGGSEVRLLCGSHDSCVYCWDGRKRRLLWRTALDSEIYSTPIACSLHSTETTPPAHLPDSLPSIKRGSPTTDISHPLLLTCVCVCSSRGILYLLDMVTGNVRASLKLPQDVFSSPVVVDNHIVVGCRDDCVYCIECSLHY